MECILIAIWVVSTFTHWGMTLPPVPTHYNNLKHWDLFKGDVYINCITFLVAELVDRGKYTSSRHNILDIVMWRL